MKKLSTQIIFIVSAVIFVVAIVEILPFNYLLNYSLDDSYFYIKTALNFAKGLGITFDGINQTNGFHPLWFLLLSLFYYMANLFCDYNTETIYRLTFIFTLLICIINGAVLYKIYCRVYKNNVFYLWVITILLSSVLSFVTFIGFESQLLCLLFSVYIYLFISPRKCNLFFVLLRAFILGLVFITRLDFIVFLLPLVIYEEYNNNIKVYGQKRYKIIVSYILICILPIVIYLILNYVIFNNIDTISSRIKFVPSFITLFHNAEIILKNKLKILFLVIALLPIILIIYNGNFNKTMLGKDQYYSLLNKAYYSSILLLFAHIVTNIMGDCEWYYNFPLYLVVLIILREYHHNKMILRVILGIAFATVIFYYSFFRVYYFNSSGVYDYAKAIKEKTNENDIIYQVDWSGVVGFYSERKIINGDGLINSYEYLNYIKNNMVEQYLIAKNVNYYSTFSWVAIVKGDWIVDDKSYFTNNIFKYPASQIVLKKNYNTGGLLKNSTGTFYLIKIIKKQ